MNTDLVYLQPEPRGPSQLIDIPVTLNGQQRIPFPDQSQLKSNTEQIVVVKSFRLITADVLTNGVISGNVNAPVTELQKITLVIFSDGWEKGYQIPILTLNDMQLLGGLFPNAPQKTAFNNWTGIQWPKCFLQYSNGTVSAGATYSVLLDCEYVKFNKTGQEIKGPS